MWVDFVGVFLVAAAGAAAAAAESVWLGVGFVSWCQLCV